MHTSNTSNNTYFNFQLPKVSEVKAKICKKIKNFFNAIKNYFPSISSFCPSTIKQWYQKKKGSVKETTPPYNIPNPLQTHSNPINTKTSINQVEIDIGISNVISPSFGEFISELEDEIFPFYDKHEKTFDKASVHGRMHAARAVIFCEVMGRYFYQQGKSVDFALARRTIGLHDAGRENNGEDLWENESANLLFQHLKSHGMEENEALEKSRVIIKKESSKTPTLESILFQSADCIDIMRPCTGKGGRKGFKINYLSFLKDAKTDSKDEKFRDDLIEEAWEFIQITEKRKHSAIFKHNKGFMLELLKIIQDDPKKFKILSTIL